MYSTTARRRTMPCKRCLFPPFRFCRSLAPSMMPRRAPLKLTESFAGWLSHLSRRESFEFHRFRTATEQTLSFPHSVDPALSEYLGPGRISSCVKCSHLEEGVISLESMDQVRVQHSSTLRMVMRSFGCSSSMPTQELSEDFEAELCKPIPSSSKDAFTGDDGLKVSVRTAPVCAGFLEKDVLRKRRVQPFSDKCWMQSLGVGLYRDKLRNRRSLSTVASNGLVQQAAESCSVDMSERQTAGSPVDGAISGVAEDDVMDEVGVVDTDSDDEGDEPDDWDTGKPGMQSMVTEESVEALEASLKETEASYDAGDVRIGAMCLRLAQLCDSLDEDAAKILMYGQRALQILGSVEVSPESAMCLQVIGSAYFKMDEPLKAVSHLERSALILDKLKTTVKEREIGPLKYAVQFLLGHAKMSLERYDEASINYHEALAINERLLEPGNPDLGWSYQKVAEACMEAEDFEEAISLCMKALPIYSNYYGSKSMQVAVIRRLMALIYSETEDYEKVLSEHKIVRPILETLGKVKELVSLDLSSGEALISLERYKEAISKFKEVVKHSKENSRFHGHALVLLSKAYASLKEGKDAARYCKRALNALKDKKLSLEAGSSLVELASVYQQLNEQEQAVAVLKRALEIFKQHPDQAEAAADVEGQIGLLYLFMGKVDEGLAYLENSAAKIKEIYGPESVELLAVYNHIAIANLELGKLDEALDKFEEARAISTNCNGPDDPDTIAIHHNLVNTYSALERLDKAIDCQKHIVDCIKRKGAESGDSLEEAEKKLKELLHETKAPGSSIQASKQDKRLAKMK